MEDHCADDDKTAALLLLAVAGERKNVRVCLLNNCKGIATGGIANAGRIHFQCQTCNLRWSSFEDGAVPQISLRCAATHNTATKSKSYRCGKGKRTGWSRVRRALLIQQVALASWEAITKAQSATKFALTMIAANTVTA